MRLRTQHGSYPHAVVPGSLFRLAAKNPLDYKDVNLDQHSNATTLG